MQLTFPLLNTTDLLTLLSHARTWGGAHCPPIVIPDDELATEARRTLAGLYEEINRVKDDPLLSSRVPFLRQDAARLESLIPPAALAA